MFNRWSINELSKQAKHVYNNKEVAPASRTTFHFGFVILLCDFYNLETTWNAV